MAETARKSSFPRGGVHPSGRKKQTEDRELTPSQPPERLAVLMLQHIGSPARPVVEKRDEVKKGQLIGEASGFMSANVHSPVSGKVKKIEKRIHGPTGKMIEAVIIDNDGEEQWAEGCKEPRDVENVDTSQLVDRVQEAGVVGMGGATFPSHIKLSPPPEAPIRDVILNGAECEPALTCDYRLMVEKTEELVDALRLIMRIVDGDKGWIGIETNKPRAIEQFTEATRGIPDIGVCPLEVRYPQGAEQQLITAITGREVPSGGGLPHEVGCLVHNVATALAIRDAVQLGKPLIDRPLTVTGEGIEEPGNFIERIGTNVESIIERQGMREGANQLILGGPMMGVAQPQFNVPLTKGNSGILLRRVEEPAPQRACIRCGRCVEHCPLGLVPSTLSILCENKDWEAAKANDLMECKECGCCAYICPANRRIVHLIQFGKAELAKQKNKSS